MHGPCRFGPRRRGERFEALANAIVFQQLAGRAAETIWGRVRALVEGPFTPEGVLGLDDVALRGAGLSGNKLLSLQDLAAKVDSGEVSLARIGRRSDDEIVEELTVVRGIGPWTAQMFLMFNLRRPDVWPVGDLGVRAGYAKAYGLEPPPTPAELAELGERFRPFRSTAAWYCWRACDVVTL
ncbi:DNA-3-methyladenine glycosylase [soil metagenome]